MALSRRSLLSGSVALGGLASSRAIIAQDLGRFRHGVASGDPLQDRVILWTRVEPQGSADAEVSWQVATDADFRRIVRAGRVITDGTRDFTVKIDADGLEPDMSYFYRFAVGGEVSPIGRTRTLPEAGLEQVRCAVVSCSNISWGYFNVYRHIADRTDIDYVLHLGDYIYEYGRGVYASKTMEEAGRTVEPANEITSIDDYRIRYQQYRRDRDLQAVHAAHPMFAIWDDHEFTNDAWRDGAENHDDSEGSWSDRRAIATRVYYEWMPIRGADVGANTRSYRAFDIGGLLSLVMLDTRVYGRDRQISLADDVPRMSAPIDMRTGSPRPITDPAELDTLDLDNLPTGVVFSPDWKRFRTEVLAAADRTILGWEQEAWLRETLRSSKASGTPWQVLGQQTLVGKLLPVDIQPLLDPDRPGMATPEQVAGISALAENNVPFFMDMWGGGYLSSRKRLLRDIADESENTLVLAGDSHNSWAFNLMDDSDRIRAVEMGTPSVSSPGFEAYLNADPKKLAVAMTERNPELIYAETQSRGYLDVTITPDQVQGVWVYVSTVMSRDYTARFGPTLIARADGAGSVKPLTLA